MAKQEKKTNSKLLFFFKIVGIFSFVLLVVLSAFLYQLDVLPVKYFLLFLGIVFSFDILSIIAIYILKKPFKILGFVVSIILVIFGSIGIYYAYHTNAFLNQSFRNDKMSYSTNYYLLTSASSSHDFVSAMNEEVTYLTDAYLIDEAFSALSKKANLEIKRNPYEDVSKMFDDLVNQSISSVLVERSSYELLLELNKSFSKEQFRILEEFEVVVEVENVSSETENRKFQIYIGGNDFTNQMMDFNMIVTVNSLTHQVLMTSIPRDFYIPVDGFNGRKDTLSYMGARGIETSRKSLEQFFDLNIDYYLHIKTESLVGIVDEIGGINYCSSHSYKTTHALVLNTYDDSKGEKFYVQKGCQRLNGIEALTVARERLAFADGDRQRQKNCQKIMMAIFEQLKSTNTLMNYNNILNSLGDLYKTNIPREVISSLIKEFVNGGADWQINTQSVDGFNGRGYVHLTNLVDYVMNPNMDTVVDVRKKIVDVLN